MSPATSSMSETVQLWSDALVSTEVDAAAAVGATPLAWQPGRVDVAGDESQSLAASARELGTRDETVQVARVVSEPAQQVARVGVGQVEVAVAIKVGMLVLDVKRDTHESLFGCGSDLLWRGRPTRDGRRRIAQAVSPA
jgi:hypothetical protein